VVVSIVEEPHLLWRRSSALPFEAIQILQQQRIIVDKYVLSPHSVSLFVAVESREAAVRALHSLI
jgi:aspartate kinase